MPFPGKRWFHRNPNNPVVLAMARRLVQEGCGTYHPPEPDKKWSEADRASYAKFQRKHGFSGDDADGFPGPVTWEMLKVPTPPA
ncbi:NlpC/P60 domain-containing protein OS=Streptomyces alboniger OX=132473 GN=CP975_12775 PE=3 SV=1 [Streptomyces alboniger]